jgi:mannose-6-phosphate isomerase-like protein (cupin superfamily)
MNSSNNPTDKSGSQSIPASFVLPLPDGNNKNVPVLDSLSSMKMRSSLVTLQPGENVGSHNTRDREELLVIIEGVARVEAQGLGIREVKAHSCVYIPPGNQHDVFNPGAGVLRYLYVVCPIT